MLSDLASVFAAALTPSSLSVSLSAAPGSRASGFPSLRGLPWAALVPNSPHAATRFSLLGFYRRSLDVWLHSATKGVWSGGCPGGGAGEVGVRAWQKGRDRGCRRGRRNGGQGWGVGRRPGGVGRVGGTPAGRWASQSKMRVTWATFHMKSKR